jgi:hypothetical protein
MRIQKNNKLQDLFRKRKACQKRLKRMKGGQLIEKRAKVCENLKNDQFLDFFQEKTEKCGKRRKISKKVVRNEAKE